MRVRVLIDAGSKAADARQVGSGRDGGGSAQQGRDHAHASRLSPCSKGRQAKAEDVGALEEVLALNAIPPTIR